MLTLCLILLSPTFWHDLMAQTPVRVIALAGAVTVIVQLLKVIAPKLLSGRWAIAANVLVSVAAVFVGMKPANFWTETTLAQILAIAAAAAGVHGTAKSLFQRKATATQPAAPDLAGTMAASWTPRTAAGIRQN
jgi:hypothetical protein